MTYRLSALFGPRSDREYGAESAAREVEASVSLSPYLGNAHLISPE